MPRSVAYDVIFFKGFIFFLHLMALHPCASRKPICAQGGGCVNGSGTGHDDCMSKQFVNNVSSVAILAICWHEVPLPPLEGEVPNEREAEGFVR